MQYQTFSWKTSDNLQIFGQYWMPTNPPKAVVAIVHGMGEHSGRYTNVVQFLTKISIAVVGFDHRGHGESEGQRGHTPSYNHLLEDVSTFLAHVEQYFPQVPIILMGHSMGGNVVLNYILRKKLTLAGAIISSPWLRLAFEPPAIQLVLGKIMNKVYPRFTQSTHLEVEALSRDAKIIEAYKQDRRVHDKISARFFLSCHQAAQWAIQQPYTLNIPLLMYHGTADRLTSSEGTKLFVKRNPNPLITAYFWEGGFHESHNDLHQAEVLEKIQIWLSQVG